MGTMYAPSDDRPTLAARPVVDLGAGHPDTESLPVDAFRRAAAGILVPDRADDLGYGPERGGAALRARLASFLGRRSGVDADPDRLLVTAGASQALDLLCTVLTSPGDAVVVADPTYHLALRTFADHGLRVVPVRCDDAGPDPVELERVLATHRPRLVYLVPTYANPTGVTISDGRRAAILEAVAAHGRTHLVTDDVYALLPFGDAPTGRFGAGEARAVVLGSCSKILAPGVRVGWMEAAPDLLARVEASGLVQSGGGLNPLGGALVCELLERGEVDDHVDRLRAAYRQRASALVEAVRASFPLAVVREPDGGYFAWLRLPGVDTTDLREVARRHGVTFQPGTRFSPTGSWRDALRLSFSRYPADVIRDGVARLARAVESLHPLD